MPLFYFISIFLNQPSSLLPLSNIHPFIFLLEHHLREDHEANPPADRPRREGPGRPLHPRRPQGGGGTFQPEV